MLHILNHSTLDLHQAQNCFHNHFTGKLLALNAQWAWGLIVHVLSELCGQVQLLQSFCVQNRWGFPHKLLKRFSPKRLVDWPLSISSCWIQTLLWTLKPSTTASPQPYPKKVGLFVSTCCPSRDRQLFQSANPPTSQGDELGGGGVPTAFPQQTHAFQITLDSNLLIHP